jgi:hypothetical protein
VKVATYAKQIDTEKYVVLPTGLVFGSQGSGTEGTEGTEYKYIALPSSLAGIQTPASAPSWFVFNLLLHLLINGATLKGTNGRFEAQFTGFWSLWYYSTEELTGNLAADDVENSFMGDGAWYSALEYIVLPTNYIVDSVAVENLVESWLDQNPAAGSVQLKKRAVLDGVIASGGTFDADMQDCPVTLSELDKEFITKGLSESVEKRIQSIRFTNDPATPSMTDELSKITADVAKIKTNTMTSGFISTAAEFVTSLDLTLVTDKLIPVLTSCVSESVEQYIKSKKSGLHVTAHYQPTVQEKACDGSCTVTHNLYLKSGDSDNAEGKLRHRTSSRGHHTGPGPASASTAVPADASASSSSTSGTGS